MTRPHPENSRSQDFASGAKSTASPLRQWSVILAIASGLIAYAGTLAAGVEVWSSSPDEQHGFLVIPIALLLLYLRREDFPAGTARIDLRGLLLLALAAGMRIYSEHYIRPWMDMWSLPLWVGGIVWLFGGFKIFRWALPPTLFLFFMAPLPGQVQTAAGYPLQVIAATGGGWLLQLLGQPAFVAGTTILLGEHVLDVERACAGLRMFHGMLAVAFAWSLFNRYRWPRFLAMMAIAPFVAILVNVLRIAATGMLFQWVSGDAARAFTHDWAGILMIPAGALIFFLIDAAADRLVAWNRGRGDRWLMSGAGAIIAVLLIAVLGYAAHNRQQDRTVALVLDQARDLADSGNDEDRTAAIAMYQRYLSVRPQDPEVVSELASFYEQSGRAEWPQAARLYELAWRQESSRQQDAVNALRLLQRMNAWQQLWERSSEMAPRLMNDARVAALRLRTLAIAKLTRNSTVGLDVDKMSEALHEGAMVDDDHFEHMWQLALLIRRHPKLANQLDDADEHHLPQASSVKASTDEGVLNQMPVAEILPDEATVNALAIVDRSVAAHPEEARPLLYRASLLELAASKVDKRELLEETIEATLGRALSIVSQQFPLDGAPEGLVEASPELPEVISQERLTAAAAYQMAGRRALHDGQLDRARRLLARSQQLNPRNHKIYLLLARALPDDATDERIALFTTALEHIRSREVTLILPLAEAYLVQGREAKAEALLKPLEQELTDISGVDRGRIELMLASTRAGGLAQQDRKREAVELLARATESQPVVSQGDKFSELYARVLFQLGGLYRSLNQQAAAAAAFREGGQYDSQSPLWKLDAGAAYEASGNLPLALDQYRDAADLIGRQQPGVYLAIARTLLSQQRRLPESDVNLKDARSKIRVALRHGADVGAGVALLAETYVVEGDLQEALRVIDFQIEKTPEVPRLFFSRAIVHQLSGNLDAAIADVASYSKAGATPAETLLLEVLLYERAGRPAKAAEAVDKAEASLSDEELKVARSQLVAGMLRRGDIDQGLQRLTVLAESYPEDLPIQHFAADVFADLRMEQQVEQAEKRLRALEGDGGTLWRAAKAARLLRQAESAAPAEAAESLVEAQQLVLRLEQLLPDWPTTYSLRGQVAEVSGQWADALEHYESAWSAGMRDAALASRILSTLNRVGKSEQATKYISQLEDLVPQSTSLFDRAMPQYVRGNKSDYVLQLARRWVEQEPSADNLVRLGQTLMAIAASGRGQEVFGSEEGVEEAIAEAESVIQRAIEKAPEDLSGWIASFQLQASVRQDRDGAIEKLQQLSEQLEIDPLQRNFVLAQLYAAIGENARAGQLFQQAVRLAAKGDYRARHMIRYQAAQFLASRRPGYASELLRGVIADAPEHRPAKQLLIALLANRQNLAAINEAIELQRSFAANGSPLPDDEKRLLARLLMARAKLSERDAGAAPATSDSARLTNTGFADGDVQVPPPAEDRGEAIRLLQSIAPRSAADAALLAQLYAAQGDSVKAFNRYRESLRLEIATPVRLVQLLEFWNRHYAANGVYQSIADQYYEELAIFPDAASQWLRLRLQRLQIEANAAQDEEGSSDSVGAAALAERERQVITEYVNNFVPTKPGRRFTSAIVQLAGGLLEADRVALLSDALQEIETKGDSLRAAIPAALAVAVMRGATDVEASESYTAADLLIEEIMKRIPADTNQPPALLTLIGDALYVSGRSDSAIEYYRIALDAEPNQVDAMNNLAIVLSADGAAEQEALELTDKAINMEPNNPDRRDTKVVVAMLHEDWELAEEIAAELSDEYGALALMHRAYLAMQQDQFSKAAQLFDQSRDAGVTSKLIAPEDKRMYEALRDRFQNEQDISSVRAQALRSMNAREVA